MSTLKSEEIDGGLGKERKFEKRQSPLRHVFCKNKFRTKEHQTAPNKTKQHQKREPRGTGSYRSFPGLIADGRAERVTRNSVRNIGKVFMVAGSRRFYIIIGQANGDGQKRRWERWGTEGNHRENEKLWAHALKCRMRISAPIFLASVKVIPRVCFQDPLRPSHVLANRQSPVKRAIVDC